MNYEINQWIVSENKSTILNSLMKILNKNLLILIKFHYIWYLTRWPLIKRWIRIRLAKISSMCINFLNAYHIKRAN